jgi:hypothetical protein
MRMSVFFLVLFIIATSGVFAQGHNNEITPMGFWSIPNRDLKFNSEAAVELGFWNAGIRYNWFLSDYFSLGARAFIHNGIFDDNKIWSFDFMLRLMTPAFLTPYLEVGAGYGDIGDYNIENGRLLISPAIGLNFMGLFAGISVPMEFDPDFDYCVRIVFGFGFLIEELASLIKPGRAVAKDGKDF